MAALSFAIILMRWQEKLNTQFEWREKVLQRAKVHPQWLADIEDSVVLDALVPRVGGVVHYATSEFLIFLPDIIRIFPDIPIYINWGPELPVHVPDYLRPLEVPTVDEIKARDLHPNPHVSSSLTRAPVSRNFPPVERYSGQLQDEDWRSFFIRQTAENAKRADKETVEARARVFYWDDVEGTLIRRAAGRKNYEWHWNRYGPKQRQYDSFCDEWDLCKELQPDGEPTYMSDDSDEGDEDFYVPLYDDDDDDDNHNEGIYSSSADLMRVHSITNDMLTPESQAEVSTDEIRDALDDLVYYRFGFVPPSFPVASPSSTPEMHHPDADVHFPPGFQISREPLNGKTWYILSPHQEDGQVDFIILLTSAASVLEILRRKWGPDLNGIAMKLLERCIPFNTAICSSRVCFVKDGESGASYWDDQLTDDEINLLCGVYMVETGRRDGNDQQRTMLSWFPKPAAWATSGLNVGFWTSDCESWYQKRLQENMSESAVLRSTNQWRHSLRFLKRSQRVAETNEKLASLFLNSIITR
ncbi:uncharacterized protein ARMOST_19111 [Armillaria ostoyae]|uniref:Uncharacterized protein n=1 Tax=Armillaria ostoyae TaxID=47428 RepID=A0A284S3M4_ARMOS|nr:uncharacterized protein ARMOST_19111 [Armillaria ostoyae]